MLGSGPVASSHISQGRTNFRATLVNISGASEKHGLARTWLGLCGGNGGCSIPPRFMPDCSESKPLRTSGLPTWTSFFNDKLKYSNDSDGLAVITCLGFWTFSMFIKKAALLGVPYSPRSKCECRQSILGLRGRAGDRMPDNVMPMQPDELGIALRRSNTSAASDRETKESFCP